MIWLQHKHQQQLSKQQTMHPIKTSCLRCSIWTFRRSLSGTISVVAKKSSSSRQWCSFGRGSFARSTSIRSISWDCHFFTRMISHSRSARNISKSADSYSRRQGRCLLHHHPYRPLIRRNNINIRQIKVSALQSCNNTKIWASIETSKATRTSTHRKSFSSTAKITPSFSTSR